MKTTRSERVYSRWLRLYPHAFREEYGEAMLQHFRDQLRDAKQRGGIGTLTLFWLSVFVDTCIAAVKARFTKEKTTRTSAHGGARIPSFGFLFVAFLLPLLTGVAIYLMRQPTQYVATTRLVISNKGAFLSSDPYLLQTLFEAIKSTSVLQEVVTELGLEKRFMERGARGPDNSRLGVNGAVDVLRNQVLLRKSRHSGVIQLQVYSEDAGEAAAVANKIVESYIIVHLRKNAAGVRVNLLDHAQRPFRPISPNVPAVLTFGTLLSVLMAVGAAWLLRWTLRGRRDLPVGI